MIALTIAAWVAVSFPTGLLLAAAIPPTTDDRQHGEGKRVRGSDQHHSGVNSHG